MQEFCAGVRSAATKDRWCENDDFKQDEEKEGKASMRNKFNET